ncbi:hypothetical protein ISF_09529 [Cordyceps fumosorosea ARSEF 2679]|uniref:Uncharacterized protein n=1 Tax=Cordyceps fumosorosea (strain ARSEF 2679) TaxID=1081104 RepID=A0A166VQ16_CORFA|nr:hypothetical protein ISF_10051 [Cordyceps fumosorosea ARSEF 2679]XP_018699693.1 hypothetical protein ISF_09529 [Cordyceps fumosorosea ARSEF 2679]OAA33908.1 hypothetical protein ISF_10051 [Cordyceps fumosorosea ARSEF 2679]OAA47537.1 hypothetical protein ISF_09529 [Cordyceps fumosorosea ARSEF 2679]
MHELSTFTSTASIAPSPEVVASSVFRQKTASIWAHCRPAEGKINPAAWIDADSTRWWHYQPCFDKKRAKRYKYLGGTSTIVTHLRKEHNIVVSSKREASTEVTKSRLGSISAFLLGGNLHPTRKRKVAMEEDALSPVTLRELYCRYTVSCSLPFAHVEQQAFRDLIRYIRPAADDLLPRSVDTKKTELD